jgi:hypothetical protein
MIKLVVPIGDQISELKRERAMRKHVYPGLIARDKLAERDAELQNARLQAAIDTLERLKAELEPTLGF